MTVRGGQGWAVLDFKTAALVFLANMGLITVLTHHSLLTHHLARHPRAQPHSSGGGASLDALDLRVAALEHIIAHGQALPPRGAAGVPVQSLQDTIVFPTQDASPAAHEQPRSLDDSTGADVAPPEASAAAEGGGRFAYVVIVIGEAYARVARATVASVRATGTAADVLALTWNVGEEGREGLAAVATRVEPIRDVVPCPHTVVRSGEMNGEQQLMCSKVPVLLGLTQYDRVLFLDSDVILLQPLDHLFLLPSPSAAGPWVAGAHNPKTAKELTAGGTPRAGQDGKFNGGVMLMEPSHRAAQAFHAFLKEKKATSGGKTSRRADQELTAEFFQARGGIHWLSCQLNWGVWNMGLRGKELTEWALQHPPAVLHFSGEFKPWLEADTKAWPSKVKDRSTRTLGRNYACFWHWFDDQAAALGQLERPAEPAEVRSRIGPARSGCVLSA